MRIFIHVESGCVMTLDVSELTTFGQLKESIYQSEQTKFLPQQQILFCGSKIVEDTKCMTDYACPEVDSRYMYLVLRSVLDYQGKQLRNLVW